MVDFSTLRCLQVHDPALVVRLYDEAERCGDVDMARATADAVAAAGGGEAAAGTLDGQRMLVSLAAAPLRVYEPSYGVLFQGRALPPETTALLQALQCELDAAETWLQASSSERTAGILRAAMAQSMAAQPDAAVGSGPDAAAAATAAKEAPPGPQKAGSLGASCEAPPVSALESISETPAVGGPPRPAATDDDAAVPWIVSVPQAIDEAVEREYNELMEASSTLRRRARAPPAAEIVSAFPLLLPVRPPPLPAAADAAGAATGASSSSPGGDAASSAAEAARLAFGVTTVASTKAKAHLQVGRRERGAGGWRLASLRLLSPPSSLSLPQQKAGSLPEAVEVQGNEAVASIYLLHGMQRPPGMPQRIPCVDPHCFRFDAASDGSLKSGTTYLCMGAAGWWVGTYPIRRLEKYYAGGKGGCST